MKRFVLKMTVFTFPFLFITGFVVLIDPFNHFSTGGLFSEQAKKDAVFRFDERVVFYHGLWQANRFDHDPCGVIVLGDSRLSVLDEDRAAEMAGERVFNFGITGGNYHSLIRAFWFAAERVDLKKVYVQVSFRNYSASTNVPVFKDPEMLAESTLHYVTDRRVIKSSFDLIQFQLEDQRAQLRDPPTSEISDEDWKTMMAHQKKVASGWKPDPEILIQLGKIAEFCSANGIELTFVDVPTHQDVIDLYSEQGLSDQQEEYLKQLSSLGKLYNFNYPNAVTSDRAHFRDPIHPNAECLHEVMREVLQGRPRNAQVWEHGARQN